MKYLLGLQIARGSIQAFCHCRTLHWSNDPLRIIFGQFKKPPTCGDGGGPCCQPARFSRPACTAISSSSRDTRASGRLWPMPSIICSRVSGVYRAVLMPYSRGNRSIIAGKKKPPTRNRVRGHENSTSMDAVSSSSRHAHLFQAAHLPGFYQS